MISRATAAAWMVVGLTGCPPKPEQTMTLSTETPSNAPRRDEPPVPLNPDSPVRYPEALATQGLGGTVLLRLFVDSTGSVVAESTSIQESSGYPALDSAALAAIPELRYAPALRAGVPVAALFLQPIDFRASAKGATAP